MIFHKSLLSACFLAHALLQTSVYADEPRTKVEAYDAPAVTHSANGAVTVCDKNGCVTTLDKNKDYNSKYLDKNDEKDKYKQRCKNGEQKCISGKNGFEECVNGKIVFKGCNSRQKCVALNGYKALCAARNDVPKCKKGYRECNKEKNGYDECVDGKLKFTQCKINQLCAVSFWNAARCTFNKKYVCEKGYQKCNNEQTGYDECVKGKLRFNKCKKDQKCFALNGYKALCADINKPVCTEGTTRCATVTSGSEICVGGKWILRKCNGNEDCKITEGNIAKCVTNVPAPSCKNGDQKCNSEQTGYDECVDGKLTFKPCGSNQKCYALNGPRVLCGGSNIVSECKDGATRCASEGVDSETCSYGKWVRRKCSGNEKCKINKNNVAECTKIDNPVPACDKGYQKCNKEQTGYNECVNGKLEFKPCGSNQFCVALNGNIAGCAAGNNVPTCDKGYQKCNSEQTGYDECVNGKLEFKSCGPNAKCFALNGNVAGCGAVL
ncbi:hypothetical protein BB561_004414 [Smittium simulii]|uniref:Tenascin-X n=1 Tax=Smittium simulii TaxID=133385 RepID=A0A2T9YGB3_9FUNG|nr:hypothetical protein BB561_004414 [Smittium simulii]